MDDLDPEILNRAEPEVLERLHDLKDEVEHLEAKLYASEGRAIDLDAKVAALKAENADLRKQVEDLCVHGAEPTDEEWQNLRAMVEKLREENAKLQANLDVLIASGNKLADAGDALAEEHAAIEKSLRDLIDVCTRDDGSDEIVAAIERARLVLDGEAADA